MTDRVAPNVPETSGPLDAALGSLDGLDAVELIAVRQAISERLATESFTRMSDVEVVDAARTVETQSRRDESVKIALVVAMRERGLGAKLGQRPAAHLRDVLGLSGREAAARTRLADDLGAWTTMSGERGLPHLAATAAALQDGRISVRHTQIIRTALAKLPHVVRSDERWLVAERTLGEAARSLDTDQLTTVAQRLLAHLDPDGQFTADDDRQRRRSVTVGSQGVDYMSSLSGTLDPTTRALWDVVVAKWARPGMNNPADPESPRGDGESVDPDVLAAAAARDTRTTAQRQHDAFRLLLSTAVESGVLGRHRGLPAQVIVTLTLDELESQTGIATTASGGALPVRDALALAGAQRPFLALLDRADRPLFLGRQRRLASADQRYALIAADRGCARPGCDQPATRVAVHHVTEWSKGGRTDITSLVSVCDDDHAHIHDGDGGWVTDIITDSTPEENGRIGWRQRGSTDPPRVNDIHHIDRRFRTLLAERHAATLKAAQDYRDHVDRELLDQAWRTDHPDWLADGRRWERDHARHVPEEWPDTSAA